MYAEIHLKNYEIRLKTIEKPRKSGFIIIDLPLLAS